MLLNRPLFGSLIETHVQRSKQANFINALLPDWSFEDNYGFSELGKIWVLWHPSVRVTILSKSLQMISCEIKLPSYQSAFVISFVYASNCEVERRNLWEEMSNFSLDQRVAGKAWTVLGDFNQVLNLEDHSSFGRLRIDRGMREFRSCILNASLVDLTYRGSTFTWWNMNATNPGAKKLDRVLVNAIWLDTWPMSFALFGEPDFSDHSPSCITLNPDIQRQRKPFKFLNLLLLNQDFIHLIQSFWYTFNFTGTAMYRVSKKLKALKSPIRSFSKENYSNIEKRVKDVHALLLAKQQQLFTLPSIRIASEEREANRKWQILVKADEAFLKQKSGINWLSNGDCNSAFFHRMATTRQSQKHIHFLFDDAGNRVDTQQGIINLCATYFENL
ncbi:hypothetical protein V5N11_036136 [Cardamine amara subsp. amara]|uniref:Endonuclease/exonuclease/phosphatase domain-containing protein n=1 Tax=Cardamine amara subsp. amara TaxID=228776 RepID=A0ABD1BEH9_CARAN